MNPFNAKRQPGEAFDHYRERMRNTQWRWEATAKMLWNSKDGPARNDRMIETDPTFKPRILVHAVLNALAQIVAPHAQR